MKSYRDPSLALRGRRFSLFDSGREVGALVGLFEKKKQVIWQRRALLDKLLVVTRARHKGSITYYFLIDDCGLYVSSMLFCFGARGGQSISIVNLESANTASDCLLAVSIQDSFKHQIKTINQFEFNSLITGERGFSIFLVESEQVMEQCSILSAFSKGMSGLLLVENFSFVGSKFPVEEYRKLNLSISESADGYGECWSLW
jgi:hypothetical protein